MKTGLLIGAGFWAAVAAWGFWGWLGFCVLCGLAAWVVERRA